MRELAAHQLLGVRLERVGPSTRSTSHFTGQSAKRSSQLAEKAPRSPS